MNTYQNKGMPLHLCANSKVPDQPPEGYSEPGQKKMGLMKRWLSLLGPFFMHFKIDKVENEDPLFTFAVRI